MTDYDFFQQRAEQERAAAASAAHPLARRVHLDLAMRYEEAAAGATAEILYMKRRVAR
jgi:hypothetical protein